MAEAYAPNFCFHLAQENTNKNKSITLNLYHQQSKPGSKLDRDQPESFRKGDEDGDFELLDPHLATNRQENMKQLVFCNHNKVADLYYIQFIQNAKS